MSERHQAIKRSSAKELLPPLIIGTLGAVGVTVLYFLIPGFRSIEVVMLLLVVASAAVGYRLRVLRGTMTILMVYFASGMAATFYEVTSPYIGAPFGGEPTRNNKTLAFIVLMMVIWVALEALGRAMFRDSSLPLLGILDNLGGLFMYLIVGILVATLLFNAIGYSKRGWPAHNKALLRPTFRQVLRVHYATQFFWFPNKPPPIYVYDLDLSSES